MHVTLLRYGSYEMVCISFCNLMECMIILGRRGRLLVSVGVVIPCATAARRKSAKNQRSRHQPCHSKRFQQVGRGAKHWALPIQVFPTWRVGRRCHRRSAASSTKSSTVPIQRVVGTPMWKGICQVLWLVRKNHWRKHVLGADRTYWRHYCRNEKPKLQQCNFGQRSNCTERLSA